MWRHVFGGAIICATAHRFLPNSFVRAEFIRTLFRVVRPFHTTQRTTHNTMIIMFEFGATLSAHRLRVPINKRGIFSGSLNDRVKGFGGILAVCLPHGCVASACPFERT